MINAKLFKKEVFKKRKQIINFILLTGHQYKKDVISFLTTF